MAYVICWYDTLAIFGCRTGWSALYDDSSDEEAPHGLHAEQSQATSLSFQPHNLFEEHFATAAAPSTPYADSYSALGTPAANSPATRKQVRHRQYVEPSSTAQQQQENRGSESLRTGDPHSCKVKRPWGSSTEAAVGQEQQSDEPLMSSPAVLGDLRRAGGHGGDGAASCKLGAAQRGGSQSPMGKPPLPTTHRLIAKGAAEPHVSSPCLSLSSNQKAVADGMCSSTMEFCTICSLQGDCCPGWKTKCTDQMWLKSLRCSSGICLICLRISQMTATP